MINGGINMQYPDHEEDYTYRPIEHVTLRRADLAALHDSLAALDSALEAVQAEDEALRQRLAEVETQLAAVPVEAIRRTWQRDIHDDPADADAVEQWLARQEVQP